MNKLLGYVEYGNNYYLKKLLKKNHIDTEHYNTDAVWEDAVLKVDNNLSDDAEVYVYDTDYVFVKNINLNIVANRIRKKTDYGVTVIDNGLFINKPLNVKSKDFNNDFSLSIEDYNKIRVANSSTTGYFDNLFDAGDYLIEQLNFN